MICDLISGQKEAGNLFQPHFLPSSMQLKTWLVYFLSSRPILFKPVEMRLVDTWGRLEGLLEEQHFSVDELHENLGLNREYSFSVLGWFRHRLFMAGITDFDPHVWSMNQHVVFFELFWLAKKIQPSVLTFWEILRNSQYIRPLLHLQQLCWHHHDLGVLPQPLSKRKPTNEDGLHSPWSLERVRHSTNPMCVFPGRLTSRT